MTMALRILNGLGGLLLLYLAFGFLTDPATAGAGFGLSADGAHGLTSMRADFTAFFGVGGACFIWGAIQRRADPLIIGALLMLVTLLTRLVALAIEGSFEGYLTPMIVEAMLTVVGLYGAKVLPEST